LVGDYLDANGVHTYYETNGSGDPLLLLHGGLSSADDMGMQTPALAEHYRVIVPERRAHGRTADVEGPITYEVMAEDTIALMEALGARPAHLVGWSDGGNVALIVAIQRPELVRRVVTMGSNSTAAAYVDGVRAMFDPDAADSVIPVLRGEWVARAPDGPEHFPVVVEKMLKCWFEDYAIPMSDLARIEAPTLLMVGDDDIVRWDHTVELFETIPNAQLASVPGASHLAPVEKADLVNRLILEFLAAEGPPVELMPVRRR
jgi:pimeloyl-ACP methyl ester carboxylesterase